MLQCSVGVFWWPLSPARGVYQGRLEFVSCLGGTCLLYLATAPRKMNSNVFLPVLACWALCILLRVL